MNENLLHRKLVAILMADVKGYSKLMAEDDENTVRTITFYRKIISELIEAHQGRVVDSPGDNLMAEFDSALNAVTSAIAIQDRLCCENGLLPQIQRMPFRIGITLGDIIHKDDRIYGDGVNIAARIQRFAKPGGICISSGVYDQVKKWIGAGIRDIGKHSVKNIPDPVRIYQIRLEPEKEEKAGTPLRSGTGRILIIAVIGVLVVIISFMLGIRKSDKPEKKSTFIETAASPEQQPPVIVIHPFVDLSGDVRQGFVCKVIFERIVTSLSTASSIVVFSGDLSFADGTKAKVRRKPRQHPVQYNLEGSVQCLNDRVRITARLLNALTGQYIWVGQYDRELKHIFKLQDEIAGNVLAAVREKLSISIVRPMQKEVNYARMDDRRDSGGSIGSIMRQFVLWNGIV